METHLSGVDYFLIVVPVAFALFAWIALVFWANQHPEVRHVGEASSRSIAGGMFRGEGREVMPQRGAESAEETWAAGAADENAPSQGTGGEYARPEHAEPPGAGGDPAARGSSRRPDTDPGRADQGTQA